MLPARAMPPSSLSTAVHPAAAIAQVLLILFFLLYNAKRLLERMSGDYLRFRAWELQRCVSPKNLWEEGEQCGGRVQQEREQALMLSVSRMPLLVRRSAAGCCTRGLRKDNLPPISQHTTPPHLFCRVSAFCVSVCAACQQLAYP